MASSDTKKQQRPQKLCSVWKVVNKRVAFSPPVGRAPGFRPRTTGVHELMKDFVPDYDEKQQSAVRAEKKERERLLRAAKQLGIVDSGTTESPLVQAMASFGLSPKSQKKKPRVSPQMMVVHGRNADLQLSAIANDTALPDLAYVNDALSDADAACLWSLLSPSVLRHLTLPHDVSTWVRRLTPGTVSVLRFMHQCGYTFVQAQLPVGDFELLANTRIDQVWWHDAFQTYVVVELKHTHRSQRAFRQDPLPAAGGLTKLFPPLAQHANTPLNRAQLQCALTQRMLDRSILVPSGSEVPSIRPCVVVVSVKDDRVQEYGIDRWALDFASVAKRKHTTDLDKHANTVKSGFDGLCDESWVRVEKCESTAGVTKPRGPERSPSIETAKPPRTPRGVRAKSIAIVDSLAHEPPVAAQQSYVEKEQTRTQKPRVQPDQRINYVAPFLRTPAAPLSERERADGADNMGFC